MVNTKTWMDRLFNSFETLMLTDFKTFREFGRHSLDNRKSYFVLHRIDTLPLCILINVLCIPCL